MEKKVFFLNFLSIIFAFTDSLPDYCDEPNETGLCRGHFPRFFYNPGSGRCENFIYGGCGGNDNNFISMSDCISTCAKNSDKTRDQTLPVIPGLPEVCYRHFETGTCRSQYIRYYYDKHKRICLTFTYSGCGDNGNNFGEKVQCERTCRVGEARVWVNGTWQSTTPKNSANKVSQSYGVLSIIAICIFIILHPSSKQFW